MNKFILAAIGSSIIATGAFLGFSQASRDAYHAYLMSKAKNRIYFVERKNHFRKIALYQKKESPLNHIKTARNYRNSRQLFPKNYYLERYQTKAEHPKRTFVTTLRAPWKKQVRYQPTRLNLPLAKSRITNFETFKGESFSFLIPALSPKRITTEKNKMTIFYKGLDLTITVKKFPSDSCNKAYGFTGCAISISKAENEEAIPGEGRLIALDRIIRQSQKQDIILDKVNEPFPLYQEQFSTRFLNGKIYTINRLIAKSPQGIYLVEVRYPEREKKGYPAVVKKIFDSFRIYPEAGYLAPQ